MESDVTNEEPGGGKEKSVVTPEEGSANQDENAVTEAESSPTQEENEVKEEPAGVEEEVAARFIIGNLDDRVEPEDARRGVEEVVQGREDEVDTEQALGTLSRTEGKSRQAQAHNEIRHAVDQLAQIVGVHIHLGAIPSRAASPQPLADRPIQLIRLNLLFRLLARRDLRGWTPQARESGRLARSLYLTVCQFLPERRGAARSGEERRGAATSLTI